MGGNSPDGRIIQKRFYGNIDPRSLMELFCNLDEIERSDPEVKKIIIRQKLMGYLKLP